MPGGSAVDEANATSQLTNYVDGAPEVRPASILGQLGRLRYQFIGAVILGILLPVFLRWGLNIEGWLQDVQVNTIVASGIAVLVGLMALQQLTNFPGVRESYYLIPVLLVSFLATFAVLLFARIEYNRFLFPSSFIITVLWVFFAQSIGRRYRPMRLAVIPGGEAEALVGLAGVEWLPLGQPRAPGVPISGIVVDLDRDLSPEWERFIADCAVGGTRVLNVKQVRESLTGRVAIAHLSENTLGSINPDALYLKIKQVADWLLALVMLVVLAPVLVGAAIAIRLDSRGPIFFKQRRVGFRGRLFEVIKFRTMRDGAAADPATAVAAAMTKVDDPRITRVGRILRRTRIDELPQIFNILRGEMSWIGPRPEAEPLSRWYENELPFYRYRHIVRPGISGWAQVNQGHVTDVSAVHQKLHYDFYYIKNFSAWLDALIVLRTLRTIVTGFGAR